MSFTETAIVIGVVIAILSSILGGHRYLIAFWQNYYMGKKWYRWVEVLFMLLVVLGAGITALSFIIGGWKE